LPGRRALQQQRPSQQILFGQIGIAEDLQQEVRAEGFTGVHGNNGATTVGMTKKIGGYL
jgi:hypothetical protein